MESTHISRLLVEKDQNARNNNIILGNYMFFCHMPVFLAIFETPEEIKLVVCIYPLVWLAQICTLQQDSPDYPIPWRIGLVSLRLRYSVVFM